MSDTPRTDKIMFTVDVCDGEDVVNLWFARNLERELNAANAIIRQQQLLQEENLRLQGRIKRLEETLEAVTDKLDNAWGIYMQFKEAKP